MTSFNYCNTPVEQILLISDLQTGTWRLGDLLQPSSHSEQKAGLARIPPASHGGPVATWPLVCSPGKDPPPASLPWHHHRRLQLGDYITSMHYPWVRRVCRGVERTWTLGTGGWFWLPQEGDKVPRNWTGGFMYMAILGQGAGNDLASGFHSLSPSFQGTPSPLRSFLAANALLSPLQD